MLRTRIILLVVSVALIAVLFMLPKVVVENDEGIAQTPVDTTTTEGMDIHARTPVGVLAGIKNLRSKFAADSKNEKNAIFADSLATLYRKANRFDSAAWFAEEASKVFKTTESWTKAGDNYYQAYTLAIDQTRQGLMATKAK